MDEAHHLTGGLDAILGIAVQEDLTTALPAYVGGDLGELARLTFLLNLESLLSDLVSVEAGGIAPAPEQEGRVSLIGLDDLLLDIDVDWGFDGIQEAGSHVDTVSSETQGCGQPLAVGEPAGRDEGHAECLPCLA